MAKHRDPIADVLGDDSPMEMMVREATTKRKKAPAIQKENDADQPEVKKPANDKPVRKGTRKLTVEPLARAKRMKVSIEEERTIDELVARLGREVGTKVQFSHVARAMWAMLLEAETGLEKVRAPSLHRPENGNLEALAEFEADLAEYLLEVFQAAPKPRR